MKIIISKAAKSAMQSGLKNTKLWQINFVEEKNPRSIDDITGWVSSDNMQNEIKLYFATADEAVKYAQAQGFEYEIIEPKIADVKKKSYADNFV